ncbi:MAG TPA: hypothetical protein VFZ09_13845 [Archangium sp.]|uniref:hypothetical protein n=1 Tax=Archangium sp. TaxID=1872627 RepID=UPI002E30E84B|nr:hypothetical protein [Archangium sp.]HEX5747321.1 hypothetical protein [Archangium sp.]
MSETWLENWPEGLAGLSFEQQGLRLSWAEVHALGRLNGIHGHCFQRSSPEALEGLTARLDDALQRFPQGAFVRLGSRSPKDTLASMLMRNRAFNGAQAVHLLTNGSERIAFELRRCLRAAYTPWIFLRRWCDIPPESEFRCFIREGQRVGVSQYHHDSHFEGLDAKETLECLRERILTFFPLLTARSHVTTAVFDLVIPRGGDGPVTLLELNPYGAPTDPCLFSWSAQDMDDTLRVRTATGEIARIRLSH